MSLEPGYIFPPKSDHPWDELQRTGFREGVFYVSEHGLRVEITNADPDNFELKIGDRHVAPPLSVKEAEVARRLSHFFADLHDQLARHEFENSPEPEQDVYEQAAEQHGFPRLAGGTEPDPVWL